MTYLTAEFPCCLIAGKVARFFFPVFTDVILESSSQKGFRGYPFIFLLVLCFHVLAHLSAARHFLPTLYSVVLFFFLLASCVAQGSQRISLPALSISSTFYDPSVCNLMLVEFPLLPQTLGKEPLDCSETRGQLLLNSPCPVVSFAQLCPCVTLCAVGTPGRAGVHFSVGIRRHMRKRHWAEILGIRVFKLTKSEAGKRHLSGLRILQTGPYFWIHCWSLRYLPIKIFTPVSPLT